MLRIVTNDLEAPAREVADLYKRRWAIELFFRWIKQTLKITRFLGTTENAVAIQIAIALIAFLLLRLAQKTQTAVCQRRSKSPQMWRLKIPHFDAGAVRTSVGLPRCSERSRDARRRAPQAVLSLDRACAPQRRRRVGRKGVPSIRPRLRRAEQRAAQGVSTRCLGGRPRRRVASVTGLAASPFWRMASGNRSACCRRR